MRLNCSLFSARVNKATLSRLKVHSTFIKVNLLRKSLPIYGTSWDMISHSLIWDDNHDSSYTFLDIIRK